MARVPQGKRCVHNPVNEELLRHALSAVPAIRRGLRALERVARTGDHHSPEEVVRLLREAARAADDAADALELVVEYIRVGEAEWSDL